MNRRKFFAALTAAFAAPTVAKELALATPPPVCCDHTLDALRYEPLAEPLSIRVVQAYDVTTDRFITRTDTLYGMGRIDSTYSYGLPVVKIGETIQVRTPPRFRPRSAA